MKLSDNFNALWPPAGIAFTGLAIGYNLKDGNGMAVAIQTILLLICFGVTMFRIHETGNKDD